MHLNFNTVMQRLNSEVLCFYMQYFVSNIYFVNFTLTNMVIYTKLNKIFPFSPDITGSMYYIIFLQKIISKNRERSCSNIIQSQRLHLQNTPSLNVLGLFTQEQAPPQEQVILPRKEQAHWFSSAKWSTLKVHIFKVTLYRLTGYI